MIWIMVKQEGTVTFLKKKEEETDIVDLNKQNISVMCNPQPSSGITNPPFSARKIPEA